MSARRNPDLPVEVLRLVCQELANDLDFGSLFECAVTGRDNNLTRSAIECMYKVHNKSSVVAGDDIDLMPGRTSLQARSDELVQTTSLWALQWKSIIRSSIGTTFYPYCLYIRSLDLRNLEELLSDSVFRDAVFEGFFAGEMSVFLKATDTPVRKNLRGSKKQMYQRIDIPSVLNLVGESITNFVSAAAQQQNARVTLEDLAGHINAKSLQSWTSKLSKLKSLTLWDGGVLNKTLAATISATCFEFDDLTFFNCIPVGNQTPKDLDDNLASFFNELRPNTLRSFSAISAKTVGPETLLALNNHSMSLKALKLDGMSTESMKVISLLRHCDALETLVIVDGDGSVNLEQTENDVFLQVVEWLGNCTNLRVLRLSSIASAPAILEQIALSGKLKLTTLEVNNYLLVGSEEFHISLANCASLENLKLKAIPDQCSQNDIDVIVRFIGKLSNLKYLNIETTSDQFEMPDILDLVTRLPDLEEFWFSGNEVNDLIWAPFSNLRNIKSLNIHALSTFTAGGILKYISTLGPKNHKIQLSVMNQHFSDNISDQALLQIRQAIADKVDGQFFYVTFRDSESEDEFFSD